MTFAVAFEGRYRLWLTRYFTRALDSNTGKSPGLNATLSYCPDGWDERRRERCTRPRRIHMIFFGIFRVRFTQNPRLGASARVVRRPRGSSRPLKSLYRRKGRRHRYACIRVCARVNVIHETRPPVQRRRVRGVLFFAAARNTCVYVARAVRMNNREIHTRV